MSLSLSRKLIYVSTLSLYKRYWYSESLSNEHDNMKLGFRHGHKVVMTTLELKEKNASLGRTEAIKMD
jgi:hypothetical protein